MTKRYRPPRPKPSPVTVRHDPSIIAPASITPPREPKMALPRPGRSDTPAQATVHLRALRAVESSTCDVCAEPIGIGELIVDVSLPQRRAFRHYDCIPTIGAHPTGPLRANQPP